MNRVRAAFRAQGAACAALGSPFMGRLMPLIGRRLAPTSPVANRLLEWSGDPSPSADSVPLRLAGALHALKIENRALSGVYPPNTVSDDALWAAIESAFLAHEEHFQAWLGSAPQTNEVRRAAAILPTLMLIGEEFSAPVDLLELGASGGLNLCCDQFCLTTPSGTLGSDNATVPLSPEWEGGFPNGQLPKVRARRGVDLNPLNPTIPQDALRLRAYLWPDQPERLARTEAAIAVAQTLPVTVDQADAGAWLEAELAKPAMGAIRFVYHTVAWQYFPEETKERALEAMRSHTTPLFHFAMEADGNPGGAGLTLAEYPTGKTRQLGRADFHGRWIVWDGSGG